MNARIAAEIARHPQGVGIDHLHAVLSGILSRRTLQRRLAELADQKQLSATGQGKARLYRALAGIDICLTQNETVGSGTEIYAPAVEAYVPITPAGREVLDYVRQPIQ